MHVIRTDSESKRNRRKSVRLWVAYSSVKVIRKRLRMWYKGFHAFFLLALLKTPKPLQSCLRLRFHLMVASVPFVLYTERYTVEFTRIHTVCVCVFARKGYPFCTKRERHETTPNGIFISQKHTKPFFSFSFLLRQILVYLFCVHREIPFGWRCHSTPPNANFFNKLWTSQKKIDSFLDHFFSLSLCLSTGSHLLLIHLLARLLLIIENDGRKRKIKNFVELAAHPAPASSSEKECAKMPCETYKCKQRSEKKQQQQQRLRCRSSTRTKNEKKKQEEKRFIYDVVKKYIYMPVLLHRNLNKYHKLYSAIRIRRRS